MDIYTHLKQLTTTDRKGSSPGYPPAVGGDAGHNDTLRPRGGHSLEGPLPELLEELLLPQLFVLEPGHGAALRPGGARLEGELDLRLHLHLWFEVSNQNRETRGCDSLRGHGRAVRTERLLRAGGGGAVQVLNHGA